MTLKERIFRDQILNKRERPDKRKFDEIRPIWIETGLLPRTHGSAVFTRGETQALVTATLGTSDDEQRMDCSKAKPTSASCCTTTSRRSRSVRPAGCAALAAAKSATALLRSAR